LKNSYKKEITLSSGIYLLKSINTIHISEYDKYKQKLVDSIKEKSKYVKIKDLKEFKGWHISEKQFNNPIDIDKEKYDSLIKLGFENWSPLIVTESLTVLDGYHRLAIAKYKLGKEKIWVVYSDELTKEERNFITSGIVRDEDGNKLESF